MRYFNKSYVDVLSFVLMHTFSPHMERLQAAKYKWTILKPDIHFCFSKIQNILSSVPMETEGIF